MFVMFSLAALSNTGIVITEAVEGRLTHIHPLVSLITDVMRSFIPRLLNVVYEPHGTQR